ncbi:copper amine oxidase [Umbelopsis sp. PMI_123]|nr:copper amine oxidase [Umbelopsis sp. PMI_123]
MTCCKSSSTAPAPHPLDPLTTDEVIQTASLIRKDKGETDFIFNTITLREPPKDVMMAYLGWDKTASKPESIEREAFVIIIERPSGHVHEAIVSLTQNKIKSWMNIKGVQPILTLDEMGEVEAMVIKHPLVAAECAELGITDMSMVYCDPWAIGKHDTIGGERRIMQALMYCRLSEEDNQYAHPLDFVPIVDVMKNDIIEIERIAPRDSKFKRPTIPMEPHNFYPEFVGDNYRKDVKPLIVQQPEGVSFKVDGNEIDWQKWNFRISFNYREGLVLHNLNYQDGEERRPLFYRMSLSEMVVPYADPYTPHYRKHAFDVGEYGLGLCTNSLALGCDCLGTIHYFDATFNDHSGRPFVVPNAVCLHEEDHGLLYKHTEYRTGRAHTVRGRRLVISHIVTVANYDYACYWHLYQDGTINYEIKATGEVNTHVLAEDETPGPFGTMVAPQINAQHHQHFFTMRIDPMIDGPKNSIAQIDVQPVEEPVGHPKNLYGNGFFPKTTVLKDTIEGQAVSNFETARFWKIINQNKTNPYSKDPVGFKVVSHSTSPLLAKPGSVVHTRAGFASKTIWVTPYEEDQLYAGGFYCNQANGEDSLPVWAKESKPIVDTDIVMWYTFGVTHLVRTEDFPIMPVESCGFTMKPSNFFIRNPAIDVPPTNKSINKSVHAFDKVKDESCCNETATAAA